MAEDVSVQFGASIEKLTAGIAQATSALQGFAAPFEALASSAGSLGQAIAAAFSVDKIAEFFSKMTDLGVETQRTASLLGVSTSAVSGLDIAAKASGGTLEGMTLSLERFGRNLALGSAGSKQQVAALQALGLSAKDFIGLPLPDVLGKLANSFSVVKDGIDKDAIAIALLGRGGAQMIPIFNQGSEAFQQFAEIAARTGTNLSQDVVNAFERTHLSVIELNKSFEGAGVTIAGVTLPAYNGMVKVLSDLAEAFTNSVREGGAMRVLLNTLVQGLQAVEIAVVAAGVGIAELWAVTKQTVFYIGESFVALGRVIKDVFTFNWSDVGAAWGDLQAQLAARNAITAKEMIDDWKTAVGEVRTILGIGADEQVKIEQTKVARMNIANQDLVNAQLKAVQQQIKAADAAYAATLERANTAVKTFQITEGQKTQIVLDAILVRENAELSALNAELTDGRLSATQRQNLENQKTQIVAKANLDRQKIVDEAMIKEAQTWKTGADQIAGAFNSQLKGLLAGTTTWAQAMKSISADLIIKLIEDVDKWAIEQIAAYLRVHVFDQAMQALGLSTHVASETAKTAATTAGAAERAAAESSSGLAGIFSTITNAIKSIFASSAQTSAEVTAAVAPVAGPAAPAVGAASGAATLANALALLPSLDVGTDYVLSGGLAQIHAGETIVPAQTSGPYTGAGGAGGGAEINFNGMMVGTQAFINSIMPQLARALARYQPLNPSLNGA